MIKSGERKRYSVGSTFANAFMLWLILCLFRPSNVNAQHTCDEAKQRIYRITTTEERQVPDSLQTVLDLATFVRECEDEVSQELELWLLNNEVFALDKLERYGEVAGLVDRFFVVYFEDASYSYQARFYLWRLHLKALSGDGIGTVVDYLEARRYALALDTTHQAKLLLDGAHAYMGIREYETTLKLTHEAKALLSPYESYEDSLALARAMHTGAEAQFHLDVELGQVKEDLKTAALLYQVLGDTSKVAAITTLLGETYAADGDTSLALTEMATGVVLAKKAGADRSEVYALFRQGELRRKVGDWEAAEQSLLEALRVSESVREYNLRIQYELALLYEEQRDYDRAASYFQALIDAPQPSGFSEELAATRRAREGRIRLLLIEHEQNQMLFWLAIAGLILLIGLVGAGYFYGRMRRRALYEQLRQSVVLPEVLKTGLSLKTLKKRLQRSLKSKLLGRRLAHIYAVLFDPELVLPYIDDPYLVPQVEGSSLDNNTALFQCAAMVEEAVEGRTFQGDTANTLRSYLLREFKNRSWEWPKNPPAWKRHFLEHHVETLL